MNRIDYALMTEENGLPLVFSTVREFDNESVYMQYGGAFPSCSKTVKVFNSYLLFINYLKNKNYKRVTKLIKNTNIPMIKLSLKAGFLIIGMRVIDNEIFCEFLKEFKEE